MTQQARTFLPAAGKDWLLPLYDPIVKLMGGDAARQALVEQADLRPGQRILEVGCGTGTLMLMIKREHKNVDVVGIDPDPKALKKARDKTARAGVSLQFDQGFGDQLPYPDGSFDRVLSSFMFHHLPKEEKRNFVAQVRRVLKSGGSFHLLDFEETGRHGWFAHLVHANHRLEDNTKERVIALMKDAGLEGAEWVSGRRRAFGRVAYYRAVRG
jgi:ubiquinone/menaquinone biosynthesis C-methylase UbiE